MEAMGDDAARAEGHESRVHTEHVADGLHEQVASGNSPVTVAVPVAPGDASDGKEVVPRDSEVGDTIVRRVYISAEDVNRFASGYEWMTVLELEKYVDEYLANALYKKDEELGRVFIRPDFFRRK